MGAYNARINLLSWPIIKDFINLCFTRYINSIYFKVIELNVTSYKVVGATLVDQNRLKFLWHPLQDTPNPFYTRKPIVTELNFEINSIKLYIVLEGKHTFLLLFM